MREDPMWEVVKVKVSISDGLVRVYWDTGFSEYNNWKNYCTQESTPPVPTLYQNRQVWKSRRGTGEQHARQHVCKPSPVYECSGRYACANELPHEDVRDEG